MKKALLGGMAAGLLLAAAPPARATNDRISGGCFFDANSQATATGGAYVGVIGDRSVTTDGLVPPALIGATVTCYLKIDGVVDASTSHSYGDLPGLAGVQAGSDPLSYAAPDGAIVQLCQRVHFSDGTLAETCAGGMPLPIPPREVSEAIDELFAGTIDPAVCAVLTQHPGSYGPFTVEADGDLLWNDPTHLGLDVVWDCPPYRGQ